MSVHKNILFTYLQLPKCDTKKIIADIKKIPSDAWFYDPYRKTTMLTLHSQGGGTSGKDTIVKKDGNEFVWTKNAPIDLIDYCEKYIFNWMQPRGRIMVLKTPPNDRNEEHIDCNKKKMGTIQHKLRIVLQGNVDTLYYVTTTDKVYPPKNKEGIPFIIDGSWPHGMLNSTNNEKYTITIGAPWTGANNPEYTDLLSQSLNKDTLYKDGYVMPTDLDQFFENPIQKRKKWTGELSGWNTNK
jgi:hypothetical protein